MTLINPCLPRDFVATHDDLIFAVMSHHLEADRVLGFLRYVRLDGVYHKLDTGQANDWLARHRADYLYDSTRLDARLHGIPASDIQRHFRPRVRLQTLLQENPRDPLLKTARSLCHLLVAEGINPAQMGVTGSLLIEAQHAASDIDLVIYDRATFFQSRMALQRLMNQGIIRPLGENDWHHAYARRGCALTYEEYVWHEKRKLNKGLLNGIKFDVSLVVTDHHPLPGPAMKSGYHVLKARVIDSLQAFDYPAIYQLDHPDITEAWSFVQTYAGQAVEGEWIEISGHIETGQNGKRYIVVGSSREAPGEYIKTVAASPR
jgi:predicted nucleotidyltransferase